MKLIGLGLLACSVAQVLSCPDGHHDDHTHERRGQKPPTVSVASPSKPLEWGDVGYCFFTLQPLLIIGTDKYHSYDRLPWLVAGSPKDLSTRTQL